MCASQIYALCQRRTRRTCNDETRRPSDDPSASFRGRPPRLPYLYIIQLTKRLHGDQRRRRR
jgi:hypothetical protein